MMVQNATEEERSWISTLIPSLSYMEVIELPF